VLLAAFCDADEERARSFAQHMRVVRYGRYTARPRDERIDAVYICTRNDSHAGWASRQLWRKPDGETAGAHSTSVMLLLRQWNRQVLFMSAFKFRYEPAVEGRGRVRPRSQHCPGDG
jgi:hypothetical protein